MSEITDANLMYYMAGVLTMVFFRWLNEQIRAIKEEDKKLR